MVSRVAHLLIPAIAYFVVALTGLLGRDAPDELREALVLLPANYAELAAPHIVWLIIAALARARPATVNFGLFGAQIALLITYIVIFNSTSPYSGDLWLLYWPLAAALILIGAVATVIIVKFKARQHA